MQNHVGKRYMDKAVADFCLDGRCYSLQAMYAKPSEKAACPMANAKFLTEQRHVRPRYIEKAVAVADFCLCVRWRFSFRKSTIVSTSHWAMLQTRNGYCQRHNHGTILVMMMMMMMIIIIIIIIMTLSRQTPANFLPT
jgi:hypothetical protein